MKFVCLDCNQAMTFAERREPGDGTFAAAFTCPRCGRRVALLANPMETQLVGSLGVKIGGRELDQTSPPPMEFVRSKMIGRDDAFVEEPSAVSHQPSAAHAEAPRGPTWSDDAKARLDRVPGFVRGMVKKIYQDYAAERGIDQITPEVMDRARHDLGLEGM
jgi:hypothetical protein